MSAELRLCTSPARGTLCYEAAGACASRRLPPWRWGARTTSLPPGSELPVAGCQAVIIVSVTIAEAVAN